MDFFLHFSGSSHGSLSLSLAPERAHPWNSFLFQLQEVYSWDYYHRLQRMFTDVNLCRELTDTFRHGYVDRLPVDFSVLICTTVHWPLSFVESRFSLPEEVRNGIVSVFLLGVSLRDCSILFSLGVLPPSMQLTRCCDLFSSYYHTLHTGRQLLWLHNHSFGVIRYQTGLFLLSLHFGLFLRTCLL